MWTAPVANVQYQRNQGAGSVLAVTSGRNALKSTIHQHRTLRNVWLALA
jgi:hypothetical protein